MEYAGYLFRERLDRIIVENEMLRAGFAAFPYVILRDSRLSVGARLAYAVLLSYAWQEGSCFPGQLRMAKDMGITDRHLRRFLVELRDIGYIVWRKNGAGGTNTYVLLDVKTKLKAKGPPVSTSTGHDRPANVDAGVRPIDPVIQTQRTRLRGAG